jgi:hypothetical protein
MLGTIFNEENAADSAALFKLWQPLIAIFAIPSSTPRNSFNQWCTSIRAGGTTSYSRRDIMLSHYAIGGVTNTMWRFVHLSRRSELGDLSKQAIMMTPQFSRPLQTALQDTLGKSSLKSVKFEKVSTAAPLSGCSIVGYVSSDKRGFREPVYDSSGSAPDLGKLPNDGRYFWVSANSVFSKDEKVIRQVSNAELLTIWDYEGKFESKDWSSSMLSKVLNARLSSPPAKMIRSFVFVAGETILSHTHSPAPLLKSLPVLQPGKTSDIPFNPMEEAADT